jgi:hypothetical protein
MMKIGKDKEDVIMAYFKASRHCFLARVNENGKQ